MSTKPGVTSRPVGVDHPVRGAQAAAHRHDAAALHRHVGLAGRYTGAVDDGAALDEDVVHGGLRWWGWADSGGRRRRRPAPR
jgi:hypothetical protein